MGTWRTYVAVVGLSVVDDLGDQLGTHEYVGRLEVQMNDALLDEVAHPLNNIEHYVQPAPEGEGGLPADECVQLFTPDHLHDEAVLEAVLVLHRVVLRNEVGYAVAQLGHDGFLVLHLGRLGVGPQHLYNQLLVHPLLVHEGNRRLKPKDQARPALQDMPVHLFFFVRDGHDAVQIVFRFFFDRIDELQQFGEALYVFAVRRHQVFL
jgi:hypothetical protein